MRWCCGASCSGTPFTLICGNNTNNQNGVDNISQNSLTLHDKRKKNHKNPSTTSKRSSSTPVTVIASSNSVLVGSNRSFENSSSIIKYVNTETKVKNKKFSFTTTSSNSFDYSPTSSLLPKNSESESNNKDGKKISHKRSSNILSSKLLFSGKSSKLPPVQEMPSSVEAFGHMLLRSQKSALIISAISSIVNIPFVEALTQSGWNIFYSDSKDLESLGKENAYFTPTVIIIDSKISTFSSLISSLHTLPYYQDDVFLVALVERSISEKRKQRLVSSVIHHTVVATSTDISLFEFFARLSARLRAIPALFAVIEEAEQPIEICDQTNSIQYVNKAYEVLTGLSRSQILGLKGSSMRRRSLNNLSTTRNNNIFQSSASSSITQPTTPQPLDSENLAGNVTLSTTGIEVPNINYADTNINQNNISGRRKSCEWHCIPIPLTNTSYNSQYVYVKRGSTDDSIYRDMSSFKSRNSNNGFPESPINEVIGLLREALSRCDEDMKPMIREAVKTLSSNELYTPQLSKMKDSDRLNNGYYDGLIRVQPSLSRQRKRSVVDAFHTNKKVTDNNRRRISTDVKNALENETSWDFDIIHLERITDHHALTYLGMKIFDKWKVQEHLNCSRDILGRWFQVIESHYHNDNSYHNATHAADVLQATSVFLESEVVAEHVVDTHAIAALIAAAIHDLDHPGRGNGYLINTRQHLALLYNDQSVLENHHVALTFQITVPDKNINIFQNMNREEYNGLRQAIVDMVLATDMSRHFEYLTKFQQTLLNLPDEENRESNSLAICRMMIKCADISNPVRQWKISQDWAFRIVNEYFEQTKEEIEKGLPVSLLHFNRETCNVPKTQVGFIDMFVREAFTHWCGFAQIPELLTILEDNYEKWKEQIDSWKASDNMKLLSKHV
uniref:Phosphodiesterase n=1 Tax=Strongyloides stercoralis TaxID=6248 RepID=A0A0K0EEI0_STRER